MEEEVYCTLQVTVHHTESSGQEENLEVRTEAERKRNASYLFSSPGLLRRLSSTIQAYLPRYGTTHSG